jgi:hypothetical protein
MAGLLPAGIGSVRIDRVLETLIRLIYKNLPVVSVGETGTFLYSRGVLLGILMSMLAACDYKRDGVEEWDPATHVQTNIYNYTPHEIVDILLQDAADPFDLKKAADAGSTFFDGAGGADLGSGVRYHSSEGLCCFDWRYGTEAQVVLRVKWLAIYDREAYKQAAHRTDDRLTKGALSGAEWCEAKVAVLKPYPIKPGPLSIHFMPNGTLIARIATFGKMNERGPLSVEEVLSHQRRVDTPLCPASTTNPWYNVPRQKHME